jgi:hypothetical protein
MLYLRYIAAELRRRRGRTILAALGLGVGVGLVVTVTALSAGLDDAQSRVLAPLTGVGTDMTVKRPVQIGGSGTPRVGGPQPLSKAEARRLRKEGAGPPQIDFSDLGDPGDRFSTDQFVTGDLSFPAAEVRRIAATDGVAAASPALTLDLIHIEGRIPDTSDSAGGFVGPAPAAGGGAPPGGQLGLQPTTVTGIDASETDLGLVKSQQVSAGRFLHAGERGSSLARAVNNLLDNAVKYSPADGPIEVAVVDGAITVRDHGPGIDEAELGHVFDRFHRGSGVRDIAGSGLGLAIVK